MRAGLLRLTIRYETVMDPTFLAAQSLGGNGLRCHAFGDGSTSLLVLVPSSHFPGPLLDFNIYANVQATLTFEDMQESSEPV